MGDTRLKAKQYYEKRERVSGISQTFMDALGRQNDIKLDVWMSGLEKALIDVIQNKKAFSEEILQIVWDWRSKETTDMRQSQLWNVIKTELSKVLNVDNVGSDPIGWQWFQPYFLYSPVSK